MSEMNPAPSWMEKVEKIAEEAARSEGCFLYDIEFVGIGKGRTLRVFIDKETVPALDGGEPKLVGIDDCSNVSKALNEILDETDAVPGESYNLEVSTPGADRILRKPWHFEKAVGQRIWVRTRGPFENFGVSDKKWKAAKQIEDVLKAFDGTTLSFHAKDVDVNVPLSAVEKSKVVFEIVKGQKK